MTTKYKGYTIKIEQDECFESPRDWDNLGTMVCFHRRYTLGDEQPKGTPGDWRFDLAISLDPTVEDRLWYWSNGNGWAHCLKTCGDPVAASNAQESAVAARTLDKHVAVMLPLYLYDHSGLAISTRVERSWYHAAWDSGQVGWIYVTKADIRKEYSVQRISKKTLAKATRVLQAEVEEYNQYLQGDVWSYSIESDGEFQDGCGGFYGYDYCLSEAQAVVDHLEVKS